MGQTQASTQEQMITAPSIQRIVTATLEKSKKAHANDNQGSTFISLEAETISVKKVAKEKAFSFGRRQLTDDREQDLDDLFKSKKLEVCSKHSKLLANMSKDAQKAIHEKEALDKHLEAEGLDLFIVPDADHPDEFMAVKPWLGAIQKPKIVPEIIKEPPEVTYEIDFVHGYKSDVAVQNLYYNNQKQPVYMTAALGVILDSQSRTQKIFGGGEKIAKEKKSVNLMASQSNDSMMRSGSSRSRSRSVSGKMNKKSANDKAEQSRRQTGKGAYGHTDDILALTISDDRSKVATGQTGVEPFIFIWNSHTAEREMLLQLPRGTRGVSALALSPDGKWLAAADLSNQNSVHIFDLNEQKNQNANKKGVYERKGGHMYKGGGNLTTMLRWAPDSSYVTAVGVKHLMTYGNPNNIGDKRAMLSQLQKGLRKQGFSSVCFSQKNHNLSYAGGYDGKVYKFNGTAVSGKAEQLHKTMVMCVNLVRKNVSTELLLSGCSQGTVRITQLADNGNFGDCIAHLDFGVGIRSVDYMNDSLLLGLSDGSIQEVDFVNGKANQPRDLIQSHFCGETWGLSMIWEEHTHRYITSGDDNVLYLYDINLKRVIGRGYVDYKKQSLVQQKPTSSGYRGGPSTQSNFALSQQSRALTYNAHLNHLAVAKNNGGVSIRGVENMDDPNPQAEISLDKEIAYLEFQEKNKEEWIEMMAYNRAQDQLAIGSHDNFIYLYACPGGSTYTKTWKLKAHSSYITCLDWSQDGDWIRSVCGAYELLFFSGLNERPKIKGNKHMVKKNDPSGSSTTNNAQLRWVDHSCKFGWYVNGVFPAGTDGTHINKIAQSFDEKLFAVADDFGQLCVYRNPIRNNTQPRIFMGHSEFVTNCAFRGDNGQIIVTTGGQDQTVIQWRQKSVKTGEFTSTTPVPDEHEMPQVQKTGLWDSQVEESKSGK